MALGGRQFSPQKPIGGGGFTANFARRGIMETLSRLPWGIILLLGLMSAIGLAALYSATYTNPGEADLPFKQANRLILAVFLLLVCALIPLKWWLRLAWPFYIISLLMLVWVEFFGIVGGGSQRWLRLGPLILQPSEYMKLALTLVLAAYYHKQLATRSSGFWVHIPALFLMAMPAALVFIQPDLGTCLALLASGTIMVVLAGLDKRVIFAVIAMGVISAPIVYSYFLQSYQKERVDTFLAQLKGEAVNVTDDGYQSEQAKTAIGSGFWIGKGYLEGTQSQLDYIPEQHTDFILTVIAEEFGFITTTGILLLWMLLLGASLNIAMRADSLFAKFAAGGAVGTMAFYVFFNVAMVLGLLPVVGVPLPLISYGGTVMMTTAACFGLICAVHLGQSDVLSNV